MAQLSQQARPLVAIALVVLLLVLVCVGSAIIGSGGGGTKGESGEEGTSGPGASAAGLPQAPGGAPGDGDTVTSYSSERTLAEEASSLLESYEAQGECVLREAGFLDLFGNAWTCTVQGPDWVDVCLVSGSGDAGESSGSDVRVVHMEAEEWRRAYEKAAG